MHSVTILMPVYNGELYIKEAIDSILAQTYSDFELLIINDGSTDGTQSIIDSYSDKRIRSIYQKNMGVSRSLNKGLAMINTPYVRRHDADDISEPWMLKWQVDYLDTHDDVAAVSTRCNFMTENSKISEVHFQPKEALFQGKDILYANRHHFNPYSPIVHGTVLCRKMIFDEFKGYRTEFLTSEDNDLWLRIIEKYRFAVSKKSPYKLRLNSGSATQMHKSSTRFFRELALKYAEERERIGSDPLQREEGIGKVQYEIESDKQSKTPSGTVFPAGHLEFLYKVALGAKDYKLLTYIIVDSLKMGWKLKRTWKALIFPILGKKRLSQMVQLKNRIFR